MRRSMAVCRSPLAQWGLLLLFVLAASLLGRPDIPIDETRYVSVAWEAWRGGDWLIMHMNGQAYHHKPPLLFWIIQAGWAIFGVNDWWPRMVAIWRRHFPRRRPCFRGPWPYP
mgnify:CR=1 FL=1